MKKREGGRTEVGADQLRNAAGFTCDFVGICYLHVVRRDTEGAPSTAVGTYKTSQGLKRICFFAGPLVLRAGICWEEDRRGEARV